MNIEHADSVKNSPQPSISVVLLCHNHEHFIEECLLSILNQDYEGEFDIVIGDDASTDRTCEIIERLLPTHPRGKHVTLIKHEKNLDVSGNCYHTTAHAKGRFILRCDGDDVQRHDRVREMARLIKLYPQAQVFLSKYSFIDGEGNKKEQEEIGECELQVYKPNERFEKITIVWGCLSMWDRAIIEDLGEFSAGKPDDMVLSYRAYLMGCSIVHSPKALVYYRQHGSNMCFVELGAENSYRLARLFMTAYAQMMLDACTYYNRLGKHQSYKEADYNLQQIYLALRKASLQPHALYGHNIITKWRYLLCACRAFPRIMHSHIFSLMPLSFRRLVSKIRGR